MRKITEFNKLLLMILLGLALINVSCEKVDEVKEIEEEIVEEEIIENLFIYNGNEYETPEALILNYGEMEDNVTEFEVSFYSSSITYVANDGDPIISGKGDLLQIYLEANMVTDSLPEHKYSFDGDSDYFYDASVEIDVDMDSDEDIGTYLEVTGGELNVTKTGLVYTIEYTFQLDNGKEVTGSYKGEIDHVMDAY
ncbi:MAG: hypothetical protein KAR57_03915 [Bacteroidales bacterium]|nr:hypothetical protein [Bacteroidales bacterium]